MKGCVFMAFDGVTTKLIINELNTTILNSRVEKIYVPTRNEIWFHLHTLDRKSIKLLISVDANNCRFHLSNESRNNPEKAPQFCMILRKYLSGAKLISVSQIGLDRIVKFTFENIDDFGDVVSKDLIVELMGKYSNIILVDKERVIDSIRHVDITMSSVREVLPSKKYVLPSSMGKLNFEETSSADFINVVNKAVQESEFESIALANILCNIFIGFSKSFVLTICNSLAISSELPKAEINSKLLESIYSKIKSTLSSIANGEINLSLNESKKDFSVDLKEASLKRTDTYAYNSYFLDEFYSQKETVSLLKSAKANLERDINSHISKISRKLSVVLKNLDEEKNLEKYRQYGELISCNIYKMEIGMDKLEVENFYDDNKMVQIPLQVNLTPSRNAQHYFKKYNKLKGSITHSQEYKKEYEAELDYLRSVLFEIEQAESIFELDEIHDEVTAAGYLKKNTKKGKKKDLPSTPHEYEFDGIKILAGRNNIQNDRLTLKTARKNYTWLHTKNIHGSHVIIESETVSDELLFFAANIAKKHSNAKDSSKVEVDYTLVKYVHKESGAKPGMVVYTDYKTIIV